jgi:general secretion pathway protein M
MKQSFPQLQQAKENWQTFWNERNALERSLIVLMSIVVALTMFYLLLIDPAMRGRAQLEKNLPTLHQQAAQLQALSQQAAGLANHAAPVVAPLSKESLETALARRNLKAQNIVLSGDFVKIQLTGASFAALLDWLDDMQKTARLSVGDANITAQTQADMVNATLTLQQKND